MLNHTTWTVHWGHRDIVHTFFISALDELVASFKLRHSLLSWWNLSNIGEEGGWVGRITLQGMVKRKMSNMQKWKWIFSIQWTKFFTWGYWAYHGSPKSCYLIATPCMLFILVLCWHHKKYSLIIEILHYNVSVWTSCNCSVVAMLYLCKDTFWRKLAHNYKIHDHTYGDTQWRSG